jgi:ABC-type lipoprotein release transport system permease subunit
MRERARLAWRHLSARPRQSALTIAGVALGVAVFIFTVSVMDGLVVFFTQRLIRVSPLLTVLPERIDANLAREELQRAHPDEVTELTRPPVPDDRPTVRGATALAQRIRAVPGVEGACVARAAPVVLSFGTIAEPATLRNEHLQMAEYPSSYLAALVVSVIICALAATQPARRAASLEPTAILRGEH